MVDPNKNHIVCAACKLTNGLILAGARHLGPNMVAQLKKIYGTPAKAPKVAEQGFLDRYDNFLTREEAARVAIEAKQIIGLKTKLFSEDLY